MRTAQSQVSVPVLVKEWKKMGFKNVKFEEAGCLSLVGEEMELPQ